MKTENKTVDRYHQICYTMFEKWGELVMTKIDLLNMLSNEAKTYCPNAVETVIRNGHMNEFKGDGISQSAVDALIVDFINFVASGQGIDYGMYTKDLRE